MNKLRNGWLWWPHWLSCLGTSRTICAGFETVEAWPLDNQSHGVNLSSRGYMNKQISLQPLLSFPFVCNSSQKGCLRENFRYGWSQRLELWCSFTVSLSWLQATSKTWSCKSSRSLSVNCNLHLIYHYCWKYGCDLDGVMWLEGPDLVWNVSITTCATG